jgi:glycosyltransferase involved in cell wall biosynthesis
MNLLLITFSFPPAGGVGVLRALSLAKYLPESKIRVDVLTARNAPAVGRDESLLKQVPSSVTVHHTWTLDLPFALRKAVKKLLSRGSKPQPATPTPTPKPGSQSIVQRLRTAIANLLLPDPQIGWLPFAFPAARHIIRARNIDAVLITVPPFSSVKLAPRLRKAFPHLPIIVDFRDEWLTTTLSLVSFNSNQRARTIAQQTEAEAVRAATTVVCVTHAAVAELRKRYPNEPAAKFQCVPNGYDDQPQRTPTQTTAPDQRVTLTYMGSVYGSTDPRTFLAAVAALPAEHRNQLRIRFIGRIETDALRHAIAQLGDTAETVGFLPQAEALRQLHASDYALLITHDPINVSAKFYDYLGAGVPILAAVHPSGDVRRLLEETGAGQWADINDTAAMQQMLLSAITRARTGSTLRSARPDIIAQYHRRPLAQQYAKLLNSLAPNPTPGAQA